MADLLSRYPIGRERNVSTTDSGVSDKEPLLYGDLKYFLTQKRHHWLFTRDVELARPLQQRYLAFEAELTTEIHETKRAKEIKYLQQAREMDGAAGLTRISWKLYQLKVRLRSKVMHYQLHGWWKRRQLNAKRKQLSEEYVHVQTGSRMNMLKEVIYFANEEGIDAGDDGGYVRNGLLNYVVTGYESIFPILRELQVDPSRN